MSEYIPPYLCSPDYSRPALLSQPKPEARIVAKVTKRRKKARMDVVEKEKVRVRDKESCRVCGKRTREVHERVYKSLGGVASLVNSMCACRTCHVFLQEHGIKPIGLDCNHPLIFQMSEAVAKMIFGSRAVPNRVELVEVKK